MPFNYSKNIISLSVLNLWNSLADSESASAHEDGWLKTSRGELRNLGIDINFMLALLHKWTITYSKQDSPKLIYPSPCSRCTFKVTRKQKKFSYKSSPYLTSFSRSVFRSPEQLKDLLSLKKKIIKICFKVSQISQLPLGSSSSFEFRTTNRINWLTALLPYRSAFSNIFAL